MANKPMTQREPDDNTDKFDMPKDIVRRAKAATRRGEKIEITPKELMDMMLLIDKALNADSNDAEGEALGVLREQLSEIYEDPDRWIEAGGKWTPKL